MFLVHLIEILFCVLITRHSIRWVSYHLRHRNKKARVFRGNCRMPKEVMLALLYGIKPKSRFKVKDLSYRKSLAEWKQLLNTIYPPDNLNIIHQPNSNPINLTLPSHPNTSSNLINLTLPSHTNTNPNLINLTLQPHPNPNLTGDLGVINGNRKQFPFPQLKTGNNNFIHHSKLYKANPSFSKNNTDTTVSQINKITHLSHANTNSNLTIIPFKNLKISQNPIPSLK
jgi:hypothetical protein